MTPEQISTLMGRLGFVEGVLMGCTCVVPAAIDAATATLDKIQVELHGELMAVCNQEDQCPPT